jgi:hypothetical protein
MFKVLKTFETLNSDIERRALFGGTWVATTIRERSGRGEQ